MEERAEDATGLQLQASRRSSFNDWGRWRWRLLAAPPLLVLLASALGPLGLALFIAIAVWQYRSRVHVVRAHVLFGIDGAGLVWRRAPASAAELRSLPPLGRLAFADVEAATVAPSGEREAELAVRGRGGELRLPLAEGELDLGLAMLAAIDAGRGADASFKSERTSRRAAAYEEAVKEGRVALRVEAVPGSDHVRAVARERVRCLRPGRLASNLAAAIALPPLALAALGSGPGAVAAIPLLWVWWRALGRLVAARELWKVVVTDRGVYVGEEDPPSLLERLPPISLALAALGARLTPPRIAGYSRVPLFHLRRAEVRRVVGGAELVLATETEEVSTFRLRRDMPALASVLASVLGEKGELERQKREYAERLAGHLMEAGWSESVAGYVDGGALEALVRERGSLSTEEASCMLIDLGSLVSYLGMQGATEGEREELFRATLPPVRAFLSRFAAERGLVANDWGLFRPDGLARATELIGTPVRCGGRRLGKVANVLVGDDGGFLLYVIDDRTELVLDALLKFDLVTDFVIRRLRTEHVVDPRDVSGRAGEGLEASKAAPIDRSDRSLARRWTFVGPSLTENYSIVPEALRRWLRKSRFVSRTLIAQPFISPRYLADRIVTFDARFVGLVKDLRLDLGRGRVAAVELRDRRSEALLLPPAIDLGRPLLLVGHGMGLAYGPC